MTHLGNRILFNFQHRKFLKKTTRHTVKMFVFFFNLCGKFSTDSWAEEMISSSERNAHKVERKKRFPDWVNWDKNFQRTRIELHSRTGMAAEFHSQLKYFNMELFWNSFFIKKTSHPSRGVYKTFYGVRQSKT